MVISIIFQLQLTGLFDSFLILKGRIFTWEAGVLVINKYIKIEILKIK
jgi:hypothetical protein